MRKRLGARIALYRKAAGLTQVGLAEKADISREYLARIEMGHHEPSLSMLLKIAKALGVSAGSLID